MRPEAIERGTCVFLGGHGTAPLRSKEPSALGCSNSQLSGARQPPGETEGGDPRGLGPPGWGVRSGGRGRGLVALIPLPASTALIPLPRHPTCGFAGIPDRIPMNRDLLSLRGQLPSPAITPPSAPRESARQAGDTQLSLLHKCNNNNNNKQKGFNQLQKNAQQHKK